MFGSQASVRDAGRVCRCFNVSKGSSVPTSSFARDAVLAGWAYTVVGGQCLCDYDVGEPCEYVFHLKVS